MSHGSKSTFWSGSMILSPVPPVFRGTSIGPDGIPHQLFDELRATDPVLWWEEPTGSAWVVTGYPELQEINLQQFAV